MKKKEVLSKIGYGTVVGVSSIVTIAGKILVMAAKPALKEVGCNVDFPNIAKMVIDSHNEKHKIIYVESCKNEVIEKFGQQAYDECIAQKKAEYKKNVAERQNNAYMHGFPQSTCKPVG